jgi:hypothetical protein
LADQVTALPEAVAAQAGRAEDSPLSQNRPEEGRPVRSEPGFTQAPCPLAGPLYVATFT